MDEGKGILVVDDSSINRGALKAILEDQYTIYEASDGKEGLEVLRKNKKDILAVFTDIVMPVMDGFQMLNEIQKQYGKENLPVIVMTAHDGEENEVKALRLGAWDFVKHPLVPEIILRRLDNALARSQLEVAQKMRYIAEHDELTGIYNKKHFFSETEKMVKEHPEIEFVAVYLSINRFQLLSSFYGEDESKRLIKELAKGIGSLSKKFHYYRYGHIIDDVFCICAEYDKDKIENILEKVSPMLESLNPDYDMKANLGLYVIKDNNMAADLMFARASMAAQENRKDFRSIYSYYTDKMKQN